jgi:hypothetical protein
MTTRVSGRLRERIEAEACRQLRERVDRLRKALEREMAALGEPLQIPLAQADLAQGDAAAPLQTLRDAIDGLGSGQSQREILRALLDAAGRCYRRAALFVFKDGVLAGWAGSGFTGADADSLIERTSLPAVGDHILAQASRKRTAQRVGSEGPGEKVLAALGGVRPLEACAAPILAHGRAVAVLYGDTGTGPAAAQPLPFEILARVAGMAMDRLQPHRGSADESAGTGRARPMTFGESAAGRVAPVPPEDAEMDAILADPSGGPRAAPGGGDLPEEERLRHTEARRFAQLLVSELVLYNEAAVVQGRKHRDLYDRLAKEIERSRQAYLARFPSHGGMTDYFSEELVRVLAEGDRTLLGKGEGRLSSGR